MYGVVALLDNQHCEMVEGLWEEFKREFGTHSAYISPVPHFSYHVAESYHLEDLERILINVTSRIKPFYVSTNGLGIFTGEQPVLYIPVIRNRVMAMLHRQLWEPLSSVAGNPSPYYHPDRWRPHITLTHRDVGHDTLPKVVRLLSPRDFKWDIRIGSLAVIRDSREGEETILMRLPFGQPHHFPNY
jgi:2'-5' RNA ligase